MGDVGLDGELLDAEHVVDELRPPSLKYTAQPPNRPPWAMITPSAPASGTSISAVTENDLFLMLTTLFSESRPMPGKNSWESPRIRLGLPAMSGLSRSPVRSSIGRTLYFVASMSHSRCSLASMSGCSAARSRAWLKSLLPSYSSQTSSSNSGRVPPTMIHGVLCLVTALQPLW